METKEAGPGREEPGWGRGIREEGGVSELKANGAEGMGLAKHKLPTDHFPQDRLLFLF